MIQRVVGEVTAGNGSEDRFSLGREDEIVVLDRHSVHLLYPLTLPGMLPEE